jgi:hypothetical protein
MASRSGSSAKLASIRVNSSFVRTSQDESGALTLGSAGSLYTAPHSTALTWIFRKMATDVLDGLLADARLAQRREETVHYLAFDLVKPVRPEIRSQMHAHVRLPFSDRARSVPTDGGTWSTIGPRTLWKGTASIL